MICLYVYLPVATIVKSLSFLSGFQNIGFDKQIKSDGKGIKPPLNISQISTMESLVEH